MDEPKHPYRAGNEPPNFREAECCASCRHQYSVLHVHCIRFGDIVLSCNLCDDYEAED